MRAATRFGLFLIALIAATPARSAPGLDIRPSNTTCLAFERPSTDASVNFVEVFASLPISNVVSLTQPPNDSSYWYFTTQDGIVGRFPNVATVSSWQTVADLRAPVTVPADGGLIQLVFHPNYPADRRVFVNYSTAGAYGLPNDIVISSFVMAANGASLVAGSEVVLIRQPRGTYHQGGFLTFGPDGLLYGGIGDGTDQADPTDRAQDETDLRGKVFRIDVDDAPPGQPYGIPPGNPHSGNPRCGPVGNAQACPEIYALGFRNPFRGDIDLTTGDIWVGDVGYTAREEVDKVLGGNYGWNVYEGTLCRAYSGSCDDTSLIPPVIEYSHAGGNCAVIGGYVYRGNAIEALQGRYVFADYCTSKVSAVQYRTDGTPEEEILLGGGSGIGNVTTFGRGNDGELYVVTGSNIYKMVEAVSAPSTAPATLSATGCFDALEPAVAASGVIPFDLNSALWSDGAAKRRWMALPDGASIAIAADGDFVFPPGTVLIKEFAFGNVPYETRLLVRHDDGTWGGYSYEWRLDGSDADLLPAGKVKTLPTGEIVGYPSRAECMRCHTDSANFSLGPEIAQLNRDLTYALTGRTANQLETLQHIGMFSTPLPDAIDDLPAMAEIGDTHVALAYRAKSYLHTNCSGCHRPGEVTQAPMDFRFSTPVTDMNACNVDPAFGDLGVPGAKILAPGAPAASTLKLRDESRDPVIQMPPLATRLAHSAWLQVAEQWIANPSVCATQFDTDGDGVTNDMDNCPTIANAKQGDADRDGTGDSCEGGAPPLPPEQISYVGSASSSRNSGQTIAVTHGLNVQANDYVLLAVYTNPDASAAYGNWTVPTGFIQLANVERVSAPPGQQWGRLRVYGKVSAGSEPASYSVNLNVPQDEISMGVLVLRNVDTVSPVASASTREDTSKNLIVEIPAITIANNGAWHVAIVSAGGEGNHGSGAVYSAWGGGLTERIDAASGFWASIGMATASVDPGIRSGLTVTQNVADPSLAISLEIKPSTPPIDITVTRSEGPAVVGQLVPFAVEGGAPGATYSWSFGDGAPSTAFSSATTTTHNYTSPGLYRVTVTMNNGGQLTSHTFIQNIHFPLTAGRAATSTSLMFSGNRAWVVNPDNNSVSVFDTSSNAKLGEIIVGSEPRSLALAPDGRVWVVNRGDATITIINAATLTVQSLIALPRSTQPFGVVFAPTGTSAFVTLEATGQLLKLHPTTGASIGTIDVGPFPRHLSIDAAGATVYVSRYVTPPVPGEATTTPIVAGAGGEVLVVDAQSLTLDETIVLHHNDVVDGPASARGIPNYLGAPAISPDGGAAWVPSKQDNILRGALRDSNPLTPDHTSRSITSRIDLATSTEDEPSRIDHDDAGIAVAAAFSPEGNYLYVALEGSRQVAILDAYAGAEITRLEVGLAPQAVATSNDGRRLYVLNTMDRVVTVHDLTALNEIGSSSVPVLAAWDLVASERLSPTVLRGKQLFYDSADPRLGQRKQLSCATCHSDGGHDGRVWDLTGIGEGLRNTISLLGHGGPSHGRSNWTGIYDEVQDIEGWIRAVHSGTGLMSNAAYNTGTRNTPLGDPKAGVSSDLDALAAYVNSLAAASASPHRQTNGNLTAAGAAGRVVFGTSCIACHAAPDFTDSPSNVLHDVGTLSPASGDRLGMTLTGLDTPTLRGVWATAPHLHDGAAATIEGAIRAHASVNLTEADIDNVSAYVAQIDATEVVPGTPQPPAEISLVGSASSFRNSGSTISVTHGVGIAAGDYVLLAVYTNPDASAVYGTWTVPTGFAQLANVERVSAPPGDQWGRLRVYGKVSSGAEPASYAVNLGTGQDEIVMGVLVLRGVDTVTPVAGATTREDTTRNTTADIPAINIGTTGSWHIAIVSAGGDANHGSGAVYTGWGGALAERIDAFSGSWATLGVATSRVDAGIRSGLIVTQDIADTSLGISLEIKPRP